MPELEIQPFSEEHLGGAAALLEERHTRHRESEPGLPANVDYRGEIEALWAATERWGAVASRAGELVGYLIGVHREDLTVHGTPQTHRTGKGLRFSTRSEFSKFVVSH